MEVEEESEKEENEQSIDIVDAVPVETIVNEDDCSGIDGKMQKNPRNVIILRQVVQTNGNTLQNSKTLLTLLEVTGN